MLQLFIFIWESTIITSVQRKNIIERRLCQKRPFHTFELRQKIILNHTNHILLFNKDNILLSIYSGADFNFTNSPLPIIK